MVNIDDIKYDHSGNITDLPNNSVSGIRFLPVFF